MRFRRDKVAIAGGLHRPPLLFAAFAGRAAREAARARPRRHLPPRGSTDLVPVGPWHTGHPPRPARSSLLPRRRRHARPRRVPPAALRGAGSRSRSRSATLLVDVHRRHDGRDRRLLRRLDRHARLADDRDRDGVPVASASSSRWRARSASRLDDVTFGIFRPGCSRSCSCSASSGGTTRRGSSARRCSRSARRSSSRRRRMIGASDCADHPLAPAAASGRADHRLLDARRRPVHPLRGGPLVPRPRHQAADGELGQHPARPRRSSTRRSRG